MTNDTDKQPETIKFTLHRRPVPKQSVRGSFKSRANFYQPDKLKNERAALTVLLNEHRPDVIWTEPIIAVVLFYFPWTSGISLKRRSVWIETGQDYKAKRPDLGNLEKLIFDCMEGVIYVNDSQIVDMRLIKKYDIAPRIVVSLTKVLRY